MDELKKHPQAVPKRPPGPDKTLKAIRTAPN
jgi:hypothetical protein